MLIDLHDTELCPTYITILVYSVNIYNSMNIYVYNSNIFHMYIEMVICAILICQASATLAA